MKKSSSQFQAPSSQTERTGTFLRWLKFNAVGAIGIGVQLAALVLFRSWLKLDYLLATALAVEIVVVHNFVSNCVAIVVCSLVNFLLGDRFVFEAADGRPPACGY